MNFKFNPAQVTTQTSVEVALESKPSRAVKSRTDIERIADAKAQHLALVKENNRGDYGFGHHETYYQDFCGPDTSWCAASRLVYEAQLLKTNLNGRSIPIGAQDVYSPRTGEFKPLGFFIQDLRAAYIARIAELGLSEVLIEEHLATIHSSVEYQSFWCLSFDERMKMFRAA